MGDTDRAGEDRRFKINLDGDGTARLTERVKAKLMEVMGDGTDDALVKYILVLLRNGRSKGEATRELNVFLGDDSVTFVTWLWDHLSSNMHLYERSNDQYGKQSSLQEHVQGNVKTDPENEKERLSKTSRSRRSTERKGLIQEDSNPFPIRSTVAKIVHSEERNSSRTNINRSLSPKPHVNKKRIREDDRQPVKRDAASHSAIGATCRLLQFAVRDAVRTVQQSNSRPEPALKRLRSVVSTSTADSLLEERPQRLRSIARVPGTLSAALKAAAEAAEDVTKDRYSGSVFDRLSQGDHISEPIKQSPVEHMLEDREYEDRYQRSECDGDLTGDMTMVERDAAMPNDSASNNDGYDNVGVVRHRGLSACQSAASVNKDKESLTLQYSVAQDANEVIRDTRLIDHGLNSSSTAKSSSKFVNISVNVNTWKPSHYEVPRDVSETQNRVAVDKNVVTPEKTNARLPKDNNIAMTENEIVRADVQKEPLKTVTSTPASYTSNRPSDDVDSRTVFVSNVHFAATKDTLSRHFNKFGEVLKVIIVNDAATGQPKGSAYVEFLRKESAESALSLNGTYFMSRSVKVVQKSSMHQESTAMMGWPRTARASPFSASFGRAAFSRGVIPSAFRARLPVKPGARSLQWKREGPTTAQTTTNVKNASNVQCPTGRNLTYVRPELKVDGSSGPS